MPKIADAKILIIATHGFEQSELEFPRDQLRSKGADVHVATLDGKAQAFTRGFDLMTGVRQWTELAAGEEREVDASIAKQRSFDPDLWVIEVEDRQGRHLLDEDGLSD